MSRNHNHLSGLYRIDVLYFDYWVRGIRHFEKVDTIIKKYNLTSVLVHTGSLRGEPGDYDTTLSGIRTLDINLFENNFIRMLKLLQPKVVLLLNNQTEDRIIIRACRNLGIKTVFLLHGVIAPLKYVEENVVLIDSAFGLKERLIRVPKYFRLILQYFHAASLKRITGIFDFEILLYFFRQAISPGGNVQGKWKYNDAYGDYNLSYAESDRNLLIHGFGSPPDRVIVVGNYNLDTLYEKFEQKNNTYATDAGSPYILYIENGSANPAYNIKGWTEDAVADEIENLSLVSADFGYKLIVKLHPSSNYSTLLKRLQGKSNIEVIHHCDLANLILDSRLVLGQFSSVLMMAIAVRKPLVILDIPPLPCLVGSYSDRNAGFVVHSLSEYRNFLIGFQEGKVSAIDYSKFAEESLGPFDGKATQRIADLLFSITKTDPAHA